MSDEEKSKTEGTMVEQPPEDGSFDHDPEADESLADYDAEETNAKVVNE